MKILLIFWDENGDAKYISLIFNNETKLSKMVCKDIIFRWSENWDYNGKYYGQSRIAVRIYSSYLISCFIVRQFILFYLLSVPITEETKQFNTIVKYTNSWKLLKPIFVT